MHPAQANPVLIDATLVRNFLKNSSEGFLEQYFGARAYMVLGVENELNRRAERSPDLKQLLGRWPSTTTLALPPEFQRRAESLIDFYRSDADHKNANRGEIETYFMARLLRTKPAGKGLLVISDDRLGKELCRTHGVPILDTPTLILKMVCSNFLTKNQGSGIWGNCFSPGHAGLLNYEPRLDALCGK